MLLLLKLSVVKPDDQTSRMTETINKRDVQTNDVNDPRTNMNDGFDGSAVRPESKSDTTVMQNENTVTKNTSDEASSMGAITTEVQARMDAGGQRSDVPNESFTQSSDLGSHTRDKRYKCDICDAAFTQDSKLRSHIQRIHSGEKPYKCDVCGVCYARSEILKIHKRTHTGEKPYKCDVCDAAYAQHSKLKSHKRTHTGEKPFKCNICGAAFTQHNNLRTHKKRKHAGEKS